MLRTAPTSLDKSTMAPQFRTSGKIILESFFGDADRKTMIPRRFATSGQTREGMPKPWIVWESITKGTINRILDATPLLAFQEGSDN